MLPSSYDFDIRSAAVRRTTTAWLLLGLASLVGAGIFALLLVLARTPSVQEWLPFIDFFRVALVVHVNLSELIWLLSMAGVLWALSTERDLPAWDRISFWLAAGGTTIIVISPFAGAGEPLMNNYVPILRQPLFYTGLWLFSAGILSHLLRSLITFPALSQQLDGALVLRAGTGLAALTTVMALGAFLASLAGMPESIVGQAYFEYLFWGGGHVLQFAYTLLMMVVWVLLASASGCRYQLSPRLTLTFFLLMALPVISVPFFYISHAVVSAGQRLAFTELMKYGGLLSLPLGFAIMVSFWHAEKPVGKALYLRSALLSSVGLFAIGGVLGFMIAGLDIVIPAHYHGTTVGVTVAFMGLCYYLLPRLGFAELPPRMAFWQPIIYSSGQFMHIMGLAWTGGYGIQRKTAGLAQGLDRLSEVIGMGLMGLGGLIAVIGGLLFLVVAYKSIRGASASKLCPEVRP